MAKIVGALTTSHIPSIGNAISNNVQEDPYWKKFFQGYQGAHEWLRRSDIRDRRAGDIGLTGP